MYACVSTCVHACITAAGSSFKHRGEGSYIYPCMHDACMYAHNVCMHVGLHVCMHAWQRRDQAPNITAKAHTYIHACMMHACMHIMCVCMCVYMCACMHGSGGITAPERRRHRRPHRRRRQPHRHRHRRRHRHQQRPQVRRHEPSPSPSPCPSLSPSLSLKTGAQ